MTWRQLRALALSESWALRHLYCAHGRMPPTAMMRYGEHDDADEAPHDDELEIDHGTDRGYQQHNRRRVPMCSDCVVAHAEANRVRRHRRAARKVAA